MVWVEQLKLDLPDTFPVKAYIDFWESSHPVLHRPKNDAWSQFAGATNLIGWRFRSGHEFMMDYIESHQRLGVDVDFEEIYCREKSIFGMFVAGVSCLEAASYAVHALISHEAVLGAPFGPKEQQKSSAKTLLAALPDDNDTKNLRGALNQILASPQRQLWYDLRNRMSHRSNLPRLIRASVGSAPTHVGMAEYAATSSSPAMAMDEPGLEEIFSWLSKVLEDLLAGASSFTRVRTASGPRPG